jgi:hypothetical protein
MRLATMQGATLILQSSQVGLCLPAIAVVTRRAIAMLRRVSMATVALILLVSLIGFAGGLM